ncbi:MAG: ribosome recycling factor [Elusimicrobiota bacterium]
MATMAEIEKNAEKRMRKVEDLLAKELRAIRTGRASAGLLEGVRVDYYNSKLPLNQVANINIPQPRLVEIKVWDENAVKPVEKALVAANIGMTPNTDGKTIRLNVPSLTSERRQELVKRAGVIAEEFRIEIRNIRREAKDNVKKLQQEGTISEDDYYRSVDDLQETTNKYIKSIDEHLEKKEKEIKEV